MFERRTTVSAHHTPILSPFQNAQCLASAAMPPSPLHLLLPASARMPDVFARGVRSAAMFVKTLPVSRSPSAGSPTPHSCPRTYLFYVRRKSLGRFCVGCSMEIALHYEREVLVRVVFEVGEALGDGGAEMRQKQVRGYLDQRRWE